MIRNFIYYIFTLISILFFSCDNNDKKNSYLPQKKDSLNFFLDKANDISIKNNDRFLYNQKALKIISTQKNDSLKRINYLKIANRFYNLNDLENYKINALYAVNISIAAKDTVRLAKAYGYLGEYYGIKFISDSAYYYYYNAEKLFKRLKENTKIAETILNKAILQQNEKDYIGSEKAVFEALEYLKKTNNNKLIYEAYNILGIIYNELSEFDKAIEYHSKALDILKTDNFNSNLELNTSSLNNIGLVYQHKKEYKKSILIFEDGLKSKDLQINSPFLYAALKTNLGYSKLKLSDIKDLPNLFYEPLKIFEDLNGISGIIDCKLNLTEYYTFKKDTAIAKTLALESYAISKTNNFAKDILLSLKQLSIVDKKNTAKYSSEYIKISDSLQLAERKIRNKLARIEFETEELVIKNDNLLVERRNIIFISLGVVFLGIVFFVIRFQIAKNKELMLIQEQQKANEEVYQLLLNQQNKIESVRQLEKKRIARELHDGILGKLFGTRMNLGLLNDSVDPAATTNRFVFIEELKSIEQEIREISHDLNTEKTSIFNNFVAMVSQFIENQKNVCQAEIDFTMNENINWNKQDNMVKINFYRILQECFQNINKHSKSNKVFVTFENSVSKLKLNVIDNGVGFDFAKKKKGIGLLNMSARTKDSNGTMKVITAIGKGTELIFEMPQT